MAHFWENTAVRDSAFQRTELLRVCQCGSIEQSVPVGKAWKSILDPTPGSQCDEYETRFPHLKGTGE